jgi:hypothetical protein
MKKACARRRYIEIAQWLAQSPNGKAVAYAHRGEPFAPIEADGNWLKVMLMDGLQPTT